MLTNREESMVVDALRKAMQGNKVCFVVPTAKAVRERILFIMSLPTSQFLLKINEGVVHMPASSGEVRFFATCTNDQGKIEGLRGLEFDGVFVDETEPVPEEVFARVRRRERV